MSNKLSYSILAFFMFLTQFPIYIVILSVMIATKITLEGNTYKVLQILYTLTCSLEEDLKLNQKSGTDCTLTQRYSYIKSLLS